MNKWLPGLIVCCALALAGAAGKAPVKIFTVDGEMESNGVAFDGKGAVRVVRSDGSTTEVKTRDLVEIDFHREASQPLPERETVWVGLLNGDIINGKLSKGESNAVRVDSKTLGSIAVPFDDIRWVLFRERTADQRTEEAKPSGGDLIRYAGGDEDRGRIVSIGAEGVVFQSEQRGETKEPIDRVSAIHLEILDENRRFDLPEGLGGEILLTDGSRLTGVVGRIDATTIEATVGIAKIGKKALPAASVARIAFRNKRIVYLSDLAPASVNERPYIEGDGAVTFSCRKDACVVGPSRPIALDGKTYRKGLGVHSYSLLVYKLDKKYSRFSAIVGLDDSTGGQGSVEIRVYGDKKKLFDGGLIVGKKWTEKFPKGVVGAQVVNIDVRNVDELMLAVDFGPDGDVLDRAAWANAFLVISDQ